MKRPILHFAAAAAVLLTSFTLPAAPADLDSGFVSGIGLGLTPDGYPDGTRTGAVNASALQSDGKILAGGNLSRFNNSGSLSPLKRLNADGSLDTTWNPGGSGFSDTQGDPEVNALLVTAADKVYVGGVFTHYNGTLRQGLLRLNADGSLDPSFNFTGVSSASVFGSRYVLNIKEQTIGGVTKILIIGGFDRVNGVLQKNIARLNEDGSLDATFVCPVVSAAGAGWDVEVLPDGKLLASIGSYVPARARNEANVVRLTADGAHDPSFSLQLGDNYSGINDILPLPDGRVVCGGTFPLAGSSDIRDIACFNADGSPNAAFNTNLGTGPNGWCGGELYLGPDGMILAGGIFTSWNGTPRASVARLTQAGVLDPVFNPQPYAPSTTTGYFTHVYTTQVQPDGKIIVGGWMKHITDPATVTHSITRFTGDYTAGPGTLRLTAPAYSTAENAGTYLIGVSRTAGIAGAASVTYTLAGGTAVNGTDYTAGSGTISWAANEGGIKFITVPILQDAAQDGDKAFFVTLSGATGATLATPDNAPVLIRDDDGPPVILVQPVAVVIDQGNNFAVTTFFDSVLPATIRWQFNNGSGWNDIPGATSIAYGVSGANPALHAGQYRAIVTNANGSTTSDAVTVTIKVPAGAVVTSYAPSLNVSLNATMIDASGRLVGFGGDVGVRISDAGALDATFAPTVTGAVNGLLPAAGDRMLIAGTITAVNGTATNRLVRLNADGTLDSTFNVALPTAVTALGAGAGGKFYVGLGSSNGVRRYHADGTQDGTWNGSSIGSGLSGYIWAIRELADGRVLVAHQTGGGGSVTYKIELFSSAGVVQTSFVSPAMNWNIHAIEPLPDGRIAVAGRFSSIGGVAQQRVAILKMDGSVDTSFDFDAGADAPVYGLRFHNGRLLIWGEFGGIAGTPLRGLARVNMNGILDSTFRIGGGANNFVASLQVAADGDLIVAGAFTSFNGVARNRIARLEGGPGTVTAEPFTIDVLENAGSATVTVKRYGPYTGAATVDYTTVADSAEAPGDFTATSGTFTWAAGDMSDRTVTVTLTNSPAGEPVESFRVFLQNATPLDDMTVATSNAIITITDDDNPPAIVQHPTSQSVAQGSTVTFSIMATGIPSPTYQWTKDDVDISNGAGVSGATTATLTVTNAGPANAAAYRCRVTNTNGNTTSNPAQLDIALVPSFADATWPANLVVNSTVFAIAPTPDGGAYIGGAFTNFNNTAGRSYLVKISATGVLDTSFSPVPSGNVRQIVLDGMRLYVRGDFTTIGGGSGKNGFALLDAATGALDSAFMTNLGAGASGGITAVSVIALFPDGDVLLGGGWTSYNSSAQHARAARLNPDGTLHSPWNLSLASGSVTAADVGPDGKAVLGGTISFSGGTRFIRLNPDSTRDSSFAPSGAPSPSFTRIRVLADGRVMASGSSLPPSNRNLTRLAVDGSWASTEFFGSTAGNVNDFAFQINGRTMAGGQFALVRLPSGSGNVNNVARFDTTGNYEGTWASGTGADNSVYAVALAENGNVWLGGDFLTFNGTAVQRLTRLNGDIIPLAITLQPKPQSVNPGTTVNFTARATGTSALSYEWRRDGSPLANGGDISGADTAVLSIANAEVADEAIYSLRVTNLFGEVISQDAELIVLGAPEILTQPSASLTVNSRSAFSMEITARGVAPLTYQWRHNGQPVTDGSGISGATTPRLSFASIGLANAGTYELVITGTSVVIAGPYTVTVIADPRDRVPAFSSIVLPDPASVLCILPLPDGGAAIGGNWTSIQGANGTVSGASFARILPNGEVLPAASVAAFNGVVRALHRLPDGDIMAAGQFTTAGGLPRKGLARLNADMSVDAAFNAGAGPDSSNLTWSVNDVTTDASGRVYAGGQFLNWSGRSGTAGIVRFFSDGAPDPTWVSRVTANNSPVHALALTADGLLLAGGEFQADGASGMVRFLNDGARDSGFSGGGNVHDIAVQSDGKIIINSGRTQVRRLLATGASDATWTAVNAGAIETVTLDLTGRVLAGGNFNVYNGQSRGGLVRLLAAGGAVDPALPIGTVSRYVNVVRVDARGRIWCGGDFDMFDGAAVRALCVLSGDDLPLAFGAQPQPQRITQGQTARFYAPASGTSAVTYRWRRNGVPLNNDGRVQGADTSSLTILNTNEFDPGEYTVEATNLSGSLVSNAGGLSFLGAPVILSSPAGTTKNTGDSVSFHAMAEGGGILSYQWLRNGQPLSDGPMVFGAMTPLLRVEPLALSDGGSYALRVTNAAGAATSDPAVLTVVRAPANVDTTVKMPIFNGAVTAVLPLADGSFFAGGAFTSLTLNGLPVNRARFVKIRADGTLDTAWPTFTTGQVNDIVQAADGKIYVAGSFTTLTPGAGGANVTRNRICRLNADGTNDSVFAPGAGPQNTVTGIRLDGSGRVYLFGTFTNYASGANSRGVVRLTATGARDTGFSSAATANVTDLEIDPSGKLWIGHSPAWGGQANVVLVNDAGVRDPSYTYTGLGSFGIALTASGAINFTSAAPWAHRITLTGASANLFANTTGPNGSITLHAAAGPQFYCFGNFSAWADAPNDPRTSNGPVRIDANGVRDTAFNVGTGFTGGVNTMEVDNTGRLWVGGDFTAYRGDTTQNRLIVLNGGDVQSYSGPPADPFLAYLENANVPANLRGPNDDADNDGISNLIEYGLGLTPNTSDASAIPPPVNNGTHLTLTYRRAQPGLIYVVETSPSLIGGTWTSIGVNQGTPDSNGITTASIPLGPNAGFLRISVTMNP